MAEAGIRELRDHLSRYLDRVRQGEEIIITDRGRAIARVVPLSGERSLDRLIQQGLVEPALGQDRRRPAERVRGHGTVSDLVSEQRR